MWILNPRRFNNCRCIERNPINTLGSKWEDYQDIKPKVAIWKLTAKTLKGGLFCDVSPK